jgi:predicted lysophospholipase L1 biosynthesis ABC-type transport system permease subunit
MEVDGQRHALAALPRVSTRYPMYGRLGETQGRYERVR